MRTIKYIFYFIFIVAGVCNAQASDNRMTAQQYIDRFKDDAIKDMLQTGVPASITLAQGMFESDYGNSSLALEANNHFGIKCHKEWTGKTYIQDDDEKNECFRKYNSVQESYDDHSLFLKTRDRYKFLFDLDITDYKGWANGLKQAGYATNPQYADKLIKIIEENNLSILDHEGKKLIGKSITEQSKDPAVNQNSVKKTSPAVVSVSSQNDLKYVKANKGDTWYKLAKENDLLLWQILEYNDATPDTKLNQGEVVYLVKKHNKSSVEFHIVKNGETLRYVSQLYGIKLKKLARRNHLKKDSEITSGEKLKLK